MFMKKIKHILILKLNTVNIYDKINVYTLCIKSAFVYVSVNFNNKGKKNIHI